MKKPPIVSELERIFRYYNEGLFDGSLRIPTHVIQHDKKVVFRFVASSYYIVVGSCFGTAGDVLDPYLHEMVHIYNFSRKSPDITSNQYHNSFFSDIALYVGLHVIRHKTQGWSITSFKKPTNGEYESPEAEAIKRRDAVLKGMVLDTDLIDRARKEMRQTVESKKPKPCFLKYTCSCPPPHNSIRSGRRPDGQHAPNITCNRCKTVFICDII